MSNRITTVLFASLALSGGLILGGCASHSGEPKMAEGSNVPATLMLSPENAAGGVGVVRRADLLVRYYGSATHDAHMQTLMGLFTEAEDAGRQADATAISTYGGMMQEIAHRQLAETEPIYTVLASMSDDLRTLMRKHNLGRVVEAGPDVEGLDITDELIAMLAR